MQEKEKLISDLLIKYYGNDLKDKIMAGYQAKPVSFRLNHLKESKNVINDLTKSGFSLTQVNDGYIINNDCDITKTKAYKDGFIYLQSIAAMLPAIYLEPKPFESILDMTAAPGGKTSQIASLTGNQALITAVEKNPIRYDRLVYNLKKQGVSRVSVLKMDALKMDDYFTFDKILLDAPCSGSGTLVIKDGKIINKFDEKMLANLVKVQYALLEKAFKMLKPNGTLIYATCSILKCENEEHLEKLLKNPDCELVTLDVNRWPNLQLLPSTLEGTITVMPTELYEGFFIAKIKKKNRTK